MECNKIKIMCRDVIRARAFKKLVAFQIAFNLFILIQANASESIALVSETEFFADIPSIESVTRLPQPKSETPAAVTIIDSDMIRASGVRYLSDVFRLVPGFQVANFRQDMPVVTYHGYGDVNARRMLVLIDGRSAYGTFSGNVDWLNTSIAIEDIERIEVIRGPNTVTYGDNAFLGTINIISRHAAQIHDASVKVNSGNHNITDALARFASHFDGGDIRVTAGHLSEDGFDQRPDDFESNFINLRADLLLGEHDSLLVQLGANQSTAGIGTEGSVVSPPADRDKLGHFEQVLWRHNFSDDNELSIHLYHNYDETDLDYVMGPINAGNLGTIYIPITRDVVEERYDAELQHALRLSSDLRLVWGLGAREDRVETIYNNEELYNHSSRAFVNSEWHASQDTIINLGVLAEENDFTDKDVSPRVAINHHINNRHTLRAAWSRAQRVPSLGEDSGERDIVYQNIVLDQVIIDLYDLDDETMDSFELGYLGRFPDAALTLDMRIYQDRISDFITHTLVSVSDRDGEALAFRNEGDIIIEGIDLELSYQPDRDTRVVLASAFMQSTAEKFSSESVYTAEQFEESVPGFSGSLLAMQRISSEWFLSLGYYWVDEMLWLRQNTTNNHLPVDAYNRLDIRISRKIHLGDASGELILTVQNAGSDYQDYMANILYGTHSFVSLQLDF